MYTTVLATFSLAQVLGMVVPAIVSVFCAIWASRSAFRAQAAEHEAARLRALEERVAQKKYEMYQPMLKVIGDMLTPSRNEQALKSLEDVLADFQTFVTVWGSDEVVEAFYRYRKSASVDTPVVINMRLMSDFLLAVRKDVAWPGTNLDARHVICIRINDMDKHPELEGQLLMPLEKLISENKWDAPFDLNSTIKIEG